MKYIPVQVLVRALRLPFITASVVPFVFGSLIDRRSFNLTGFLLGLTIVSCSHLSANLINDYADSKSGADWKDLRFWGVFGGSKLIQEKVLSAGFYLKAALFFGLVSLIAAVALAALLSNTAILLNFGLVVLLSWSYSCPPLKFSYRRMGEVIIFLLFGPVLAVGGHFIQTGIAIDLKSLFLSVPFGLLVLAILLANEVPDYPQDRAAGKMNWISIIGPEKAYRLYASVVSLAYLCIAVAVSAGFLNILALLSFLFIYPAAKATVILRKYPTDKEKLLVSSKLTIGLQLCLGLCLIIGVI